MSSSLSLLTQRSRFKWQVECCTQLRCIANADWTSWRTLASRVDQFSRESRVCFGGCFINFICYSGFSHSISEVVKLLRCIMHSCSQDATEDCGFLEKMLTAYYSLSSTSFQREAILRISFPIRRRSPNA